MISCNRQNKIETPSTLKVNDYKFDFSPSDDLVRAFTQAENENKLVYVDIGTSWCLPCQIMKEEVYTDEDLGNYMNDRFISVLIDAEKPTGIPVAFEYMVEAYPTLLFLDTKGAVLERKVGAAYHRELRDLAEAAIAQVNGATGE